MPQDEIFWNPYRLIPVRGSIERKSPSTDEKFTGQSGFIHCTLENLTPLFIGGNRYNKQLFLTRNDRCLIPGTSLKGMLRSLAEIVGGGCNITDTKGEYSPENMACKHADRLCIACRMFGMMERGSGAKVHKGNISVGDALVREEKPETQTFEILLSSCGTRHEPFYRTLATGRLDGKSRKLYFHQPRRTDSVPSVPQNLKSRAWTINALVPGHRFDFKIHFSNLGKEELELLAYVLDLEEVVHVEIDEGKFKLNGPLRHKIGNAKPLGLGSCYLEVKKIVYHAKALERFTKLDNKADTVYEGNALKSELAELKKKWVNDNSETMQQLRKMLVWDKNDPREFRYPDWHWFQNPANSQKSLKVI